MSDTRRKEYSKLFVYLGTRFDTEQLKKTVLTTQTENNVERSPASYLVQKTAKLSDGNRIAFTFSCYVDYDDNSHESAYVSVFTADDRVCSPLFRLSFFDVEQIWIFSNNTFGLYYHTNFTFFTPHRQVAMYQLVTPGYFEAKKALYLMAQGNRTSSRYNPCLFSRLPEDACIKIADMLGGDENKDFTAQFAKEVNLDAKSDDVRRIRAPRTFLEGLAMCFFGYTPPITYLPNKSDTMMPGQKSYSRS